MARVLVLLLLASAAAAGPRDLAEEFFRAHRARDVQRQTLLAAKPALEVPYALVVDALLKSGHVEAGEALAALRHGPESEGLKKLVATFKAGGTVSRAQAAALAEAGKVLKDDPDAALKALHGAGAPVAGTILACRIAYTRVRVYEATARPAAALDELANTAAFARAVGWWHLARDAERHRLDRLKTQPDRAIEAADRLIEACDRLDDRKQKLAALQLRSQAYHQRAAVELTKGKPDQNTVDQARRQSRADLAAAAEIAAGLGDNRLQGILYRNLGYLFHEQEFVVKSALAMYRRSIEVLRPLGERKLVGEVLFNIAVLLRDAGRYGEALEALEEFLAGARAPYTIEQQRALGMRAYLFYRQLRVESAMAAYGRALKAARRPDVMRELFVQAGELQFLRGDLDEAGRLFKAALELDAKHAGALAGRARLKSLRGDEGGATADFDAALAVEDDPARRAQLLLVRVAQERSWGRVDRAVRTAREALGLLDGLKGPRGLGNAASVFYVLADLHLLRRDFAAATGPLERGAVLFQRLNDVNRAIPAYVRESLVHVQLGDMEKAIPRLQFALKMAAGTPRDDLKSLACCAEAIFAGRSGSPDQAVAKLDEARALAEASGDAITQATVLANLALFRKHEGGELARRAYELLDTRRLEGAEEHPLVEGERPDRAGSIGVAALLHEQRAALAALGLKAGAAAAPAAFLAAESGRAALAYELVERVRADRLQVALRGREQILHATLTPDDRQAYVAARGRLIQARAERRGVAEAEAAFDAFVDTLGGPARALAFPRPVPLDELQARLREHEVLLLLLHDDYAAAAVAITRDRVALRPLDPERPLAGVADLLDGKSTVLVAPDGRWAAVPLAVAPGAGTLRFFHVASAAAFAARRVAAPVAPGTGAARIGPGPEEFGPPRGRNRLLHLGDRTVLDLRHPQASRVGEASARVLLTRSHVADVVVAPRTSGAVRGLPRGEGVAALVEALHAGGARGVVVSLAGDPPAELLERFYASCLEGTAPADALHAAQAAYRASGKAALDADWAGLAYWGVPD